VAWTMPAVVDLSPHARPPAADRAIARLVADKALAQLARTSRCILAPCADRAPVARRQDRAPASSMRSVTRLY